ncbi:hypothetical protein [uncultured Gammaproteobacteria bacterium]|nr:hypothetical protein [uncultured Gammaproteobacteria bacterium]VVH61575.1 hypothetical protein BSPWISOX_2360 [uncultured Gammaproteobacteria bacterium]VVM17634.1 hypothetical protein BSPWISOXPB_2884 [uncultured Gammaproteobacteria bacterium]
MKYSHSKAMAVFYKIVKLAKNGVLMIIHIYAKVSYYFKKNLCVKHEHFHPLIVSQVYSNICMF